jgi:hypothetical protein
MKTQYAESLVAEVDVRYKPLLKASELLLLLYSRRASFFSSSIVMINPLEYHGACGGGADDRVKR